MQYHNVDNVDEPAELLPVIQALVAENIWSGGYKLRVGQYSDAVAIHHPDFNDHPLLIQTLSAKGLTVKGVEELVRKHVETQAGYLQAEITERSDKIRKLRDLPLMIDVAKAKAKIVETFPEAKDVPYLWVTRTAMGDDLFAFANEGAEHIFVACQINGEFTGGVARVRSTIAQWADGICDSHGRYKKFWIALARDYVSKHFAVLRDELLRDLEVLASERSVEEVHLQSTKKPEDIIIITFMEGLPCRAGWL